MFSITLEKFMIGKLSKSFDDYYDDCDPRNEDFHWDCYDEDELGDESTTRKPVDIDKFLFDDPPF